METTTYTYKSNGEQHAAVVDAACVPAIEAMLQAQGQDAETLGNAIKVALKTALVERDAQAFRMVAVAYVEYLVRYQDADAEDARRITETLRIRAFGN